LATRRPKSARHPPAPARRPRHALLLAALWAAALAAYSNSFQAGLVFDSQRAILADSRIQAATAENGRLIWTEDYYFGTGSGALYRPLTTFSFLWNYAILGDGPHAAGYHRVNFTLHAVNVALVYLLGWLIFAEVWPAFALAALWALHPVLTESVTNVAGRADLLAAFGSLAGLLCYARSSTHSGWRRAAWLVALAAAAAIGVFSKESGVVLVAVMIVYDFALAPKNGPKTAWRARAVGYFAAALPVAIFLALRSRALARVSSLVISFCDNPLLQAGFWTGRLTAVKVLGEYLRLLLWPGRLSADYSYNQVPLFGWRFSTWEDAKTVLALLVWIAIAAAAPIGYRRARPAFFFLAFFLATIAPVSNLVIPIGSIMAERFLYLPSIGFAGCVVWSARAAYRHAPTHWPAPRTVLSAALTLACLALGARTYARNFDWRDERSLWSSAVQAAPGSYKTHQNMALVSLAQPRPDFAAATREVEKSLAILDSLPDARSVPSVYATAGLCYRTRGDLSKALAVLLRGRNIDRAWDDAVQLRNRLDGKSISAVGTPPLYLDLGRVYGDLGQPEKALEAFRYGRSIDPQPAFFEEISRTYRGMGQPEQAAISLLEGLAVDSSQAGLVSEVAQLYQETEPQSCALDHGGTGVSLNLNCPLVHQQLCAAARNVVEMFTAMRDPASASATAQNAIRGWGCAAETFR
jgi:tetratricopeptide (TPR) repeat protein